jgi:type IV secretion system protein VirD4
MSETNSSITKTRAIGSVYLLLLIVGINSLCTQFVADRLAYHPSLGTPLFGQIYSPLKWWDWLFKFYDYAPTTYNYAFIIFALGVLFALLAFVVTVGMKSRSSRKHEGTHGTAAFASRDQVLDTGLLHDRSTPGSGVYCGGYDDEKTGRTQYLRHDGPEHICAIAPTRSGKGVGLVVPTLLSWPESVFVLDRKGENSAMTAGWRQKQDDRFLTVVRSVPKKQRPAFEGWSLLAISHP